MSLHPGEDWKSDRRMYANEAYYKIYGQDQAAPTPQETPPDVYSEYPDRSDCVSVGLYTVTRHLADETQLTDTLCDAFGSSRTHLILDLAMYMLSANSAVFQHYPHWAKSHAIFSESVRSDSYI